MKLVREKDAETVKVANGFAIAEKGVIVVDFDFVEQQVFEQEKYRIEVQIEKTWTQGYLITLDYDRGFALVAVKMQFENVFLPGSLSPGLVDMPLIMTKLPVESSSTGGSHELRLVRSLQQLPAVAGQDFGRYRFETNASAYLGGAPVIDSNGRLAGFVRKSNVQKNGFEIVSARALSDFLRIKGIDLYSKKQIRLPNLRSLTVKVLNAVNTQAKVRAEQWLKSPGTHRVGTWQVSLPELNFCAENNFALPKTGMTVFEKNCSITGTFLKSQNISIGEMLFRYSELQSKRGIRAVFLGAKKLYQNLNIARKHETWGNSSKQCSHSVLTNQLGSQLKVDFCLFRHNAIDDLYALQLRLIDLEMHDRQLVGYGWFAGFPFASVQSMFRKFVESVMQDKK